MRGFCVLTIYMYYFTYMYIYCSYNIHYFYIYLYISIFFHNKKLNLIEIILKKYIYKNVSKTERSSNSNHAQKELGKVWEPGVMVSVSYSSEFCSLHTFLSDPSLGLCTCTEQYNLD